MSEVIFAFLIGIAFDKVQMLISAFNYNADFNGFGVIDMVNKKEIKAPMAYRVLVPWLVGWIEKTFKIDFKYRVFIYQALKAFFVMLAAWSVIHVYGLLIALITFMLLLLTVQFDYWDWSIELAAIVLASGGMFIPALIVAILFALSRETAPITALVYFSMTLDLVGSAIILVATLAVLGAVRLYIGKRNLYCKRVMVRENIKLFKNFFKWKPLLYAPLTVTTMISIAAIISVIVNPRYWYILIIVAAGLILAKADEPRVFSACLPFIALMLSKGLF